MPSREESKLIAKNRANRTRVKLDIRPVREIAEPLPTNVRARARTYMASQARSHRR